MTIRFMSRQEIADHLGVTLATVKRYVDFPPPDVIVGRNQGWARETIDRWNAGRVKKVKPAAFPDPTRDSAGLDYLPDGRHRAG